MTLWAQVAELVAEHGWTVDTQLAHTTRVNRADMTLSIWFRLDGSLDVWFRNGRTMYSDHQGTLLLSTLARRLPGTPRRVPVHTSTGCPVCARRIKLTGKTGHLWRHKDGRRGYLGACPAAGLTLDEAEAL